MQTIFNVLATRWLPPVLWRCWLGGRKGIRLVKTEWWGAGIVVCLERGADLHMAQVMPLPLTVSCFSKIQIGFTFLVPAHPGSPGKRAVKRVCVCALWFQVWQKISYTIPIKLKDFFKAFKTFKWLMVIFVYYQGLELATVKFKNDWHLKT